MARIKLGNLDVRAGLTSHIIFQLGMVHLESIKSIKGMHLRLCFEDLKSPPSTPNAINYTQLLIAK